MDRETRIAVVGYGLIGRRHVEAIAAVPGATLAAVVEPAGPGHDAAKAAGHKTFHDINDMLAASLADAVILATPTLLHAEQAMACIDRDLPVLIEKPITHAAAAAIPVVTRAAERGVPLLVGHHRRHNAIVRAAKRALDDGAIGQIRSAQCTCWFYKPDHYFAAAPWRTKKGAGPISVNLVHDVDLMRHFCGEVESVRAVASPAIRGFENEDLAAAVLQFRSGVVATLSVSDAIAAPWNWEMTSGENPAYPKTDQSSYLLGGSTGALSVPDLRLWTYDGAPDWWDPIRSQVLDAGGGDPLHHQIAQFLRVIEGREPPVVSGAEGLRSLQVVEAVQQSATSGQPVNIEALDLP